MLPMANEDLIRGGTASVTAGQVTVTGQGVSWANVREGDFFGAHVGLAVPIAAIAGDAITLAFPWTGPTQAAAAYAIQPKGDVTRFQDRVRLLVESLANGTLAALTAAGSGANKLAYYTGAGVAALADFKASARSLLGLTPVADRLPYFTDANTAALTTLTPFARTSLLAPVDRPALLGGLSISTKVPGSGVLSADLNLETTTGWVIAGTGLTANMPIAGIYGHVFIQAWNDGVTCTQTFVVHGGIPRRQWVRTKLNSTTWEAWTEQVQHSFSSIEQGGGPGQGTNKVKIGYDLALGGLRAQVDSADYGRIWTDSIQAASAVGASGYQRLPNGIIFQWGYSDNVGSITYPLAFPNTSMSVVPQILSTNPTLLMWSIVVASNNNNGFSVTRRVTGGGGGAVADTAASFCWIAMGR
jgi:hypothetical protein